MRVRARACDLTHDDFGGERFLREPGQVRASLSTSAAGATRPTRMRSS